ncbi:choice-of-anchor K domain-containing protein [Prosthecobacter sp.]|uniref:choice-of-anchor K domain-containing protein n=1 Tax=Prosthecobacter sp. TaxID=1965333 RepID=UPI002ABB93CF|nr:choice-of-anchor K domain-containing protein [Prosthecobacter sp.]MDZ4404822.1 choice-of-anchor K domain-containing protein [Prosthecobacter sp.]
MLSSRFTVCDSASRSSICRAGFSLLELVITIAIIGVIVTLGVSLITDDAGSARVAKLESDVSTLNQMVALYVADGGNLAGLTSPQAVLDKMKRIRPQSEWQRHVGAVSGRLLDGRLRAKMTSQPDNDNNPRVVWNRTKNRFELTKASGTAVSEFYLDESLAGTDFGTETRTKSSVAFNSSTKGWIWGASVSDPAANYLNPQPFGTPTPANGFDPNESSPTSGDPPADESDGGSGGSGGGGGDPSTPPTVTKLPRPVITPAGGTFAFASFPSSATISPNGALPEVSKLMYRINSGTWIEFTGASIPLTPAMNLQARNETTRPAEYSTSSTTSQTYYRLTSSFSGTGEGNWGNAIGGTNLVTTIQNGSETSTFKHGNTKLDLGNGEYLDAGVENVLSFTREAFDTITPNTWFKFGELMMLNGTTFYNSEATGVTLSVNLTMTQPALNFTTHIDLGLTSTENTSDRLASADVVELKNPTTDVRVTIDGVEYRLELSWVTLDPGAGVVQGNKFLIFEGATAKAELRARFTSNH